ncbi:MAG TPA: phenylacetate--CoA ligase [Vicinamibacteria bacterium]|nr:phenylacetate--CoA ligase [Vicinamibacteria bacterium]
MREELEPQHRINESAGKALYWNAEAETLPREKLESLQLGRLKAQIARATERVGFYRNWARRNDISPVAIRSLEDLALLPFTSKTDLRDHYPFGMCAVPVSELVRIHATSGTTGKPTIAPYTRSDLELWAEVMARVLTAGGVSSHDVVHNAYGYGLFTGGLGFGLGAEAIGCATIPTSTGLTQRQLMLMEDLGATVLCCTPSYALVIAEEAEAQGIDVRRRMRLRVGFFGAEPWTEEMRREIEDRLGLEAFDIYGLAEIIGPGVGVECQRHNGLHLFEDHFLAEIVDPESGTTLSPGSTGELVLTSLSREALPLIRYRTRDRVRLTREACPCGRTFSRMSKPLGRTDDMLIIRGVNVFPSQIEATLLEVEGLAPQYLILVDRERHRLDDLEVWVEASPSLFADGDYAMKRVEAEANRRVRDVLGISARVVVVTPKRIERVLGKAVRVVDRRSFPS